MKTVTNDDASERRSGKPLRYSSGSASLPHNSASLPPAHDYLRRLPPEAYRGRACVHWALTVAHRRTGWLGAPSHALWRETWLHTLARYHLAVPVYCLMPDHAHALVVGMSAESDQRLALSFLRRHTAGMFAIAGSVDGEAEPKATPLRSGSASLPPESASLPPSAPRWQKQGYDHVLREHERTRGAFAAVAHYIIENPVRAGLVERAEDWPYSGSLVAGWPDLDWRRNDFWERWWKIFAEAE
jgi:REP element-mobilizing transposase RayT